MNLDLLNIIAPLAGAMQEQHQRPLFRLSSVIILRQVDQVPQRDVVLAILGLHPDGRRCCDLLARRGGLGASRCDASQQTNADGNESQATGPHNMAPSDQIWPVLSAVGLQSTNARSTGTLGRMKLLFFS